MTIPYLKEIIIAGLAIGAMALYVEGRRAGYNACEVRYVKAVAVRDEMMGELKAEHTKALKKFETKIEQTKRNDDERIKKLLLENQKLQDWWTTPVPADAAAYAWGVRDAGDRTVPR